MNFPLIITLTTALIEIHQD